MYFFQLVKVGLMCGFFCLRANNFSGIKSELSIVSIVKLKSLLSTLAIIFNIYNILYICKQTEYEGRKNGYVTDLESLNSELGGRGGAMKYVASIRGGG